MNRASFHEEKLAQLQEINYDHNHLINGLPNVRVRVSRASRFVEQSAKSSTIVKNWTLDNE